VMMVQKEEVSLRVWDTSGQEKYRPIVGYHLQECQVLIFMYNLTDLESKTCRYSALLEIEGWIVHLRKEGMEF
jgi:GTPase SAR1 family protein